MREIGTVRTQGLNLHVEPRAHAGLVDQLARGDQLEVVGRRIDWMQVVLLSRSNGNRVGVGEKGWVFAADVDTVVLPPAPDLGEVVVTKEEEEWLSAGVWFFVCFVIVALVAVVALFWHGDL